MDVYKVSRLGRCRDFKSLQTIFITINDSAVFCGCQDFEFFNEIKVYGLKRSVYSVLLRSVAVYLVENVQKRIFVVGFFLRRLNSAYLLLSLATRPQPSLIICNGRGQVKGDQHGISTKRTTADGKEGKKKGQRVFSSCTFASPLAGLVIPQ